MGLELLKQDDEGKLVEIKNNNPKNTSECCKEMFQLWLEKYSNDATWLRLIQALRETDFKTLADRIEGMLRPVEETISHTNTGTYLLSTGTVGMY